MDLNNKRLLRPSILKSLFFKTTKRPSIKKTPIYYTDLYNKGLPVESQYSIIQKMYLNNRYPSSYDFLQKHNQ